jgi:hypothetical protein
MKPAFCEKHGVQQFVIASPRLAAAISLGKLIEATDIRKIKIEYLGKKFEYFVDSEFLKEFKIDLNEPTIILKDRDKASKQLNDRLIIQKIAAGMKWVCPVCLNTIVA